MAGDSERAKALMRGIGLEPDQEFWSVEFQQGVMRKLMIDPEKFRENPDFVTLEIRAKRALMGKGAALTAEQTRFLGWLTGWKE